MIELKNIQSTAQSLIASASYFAGETVLAHLGLSDDLAEAALNTRGFCVGVLPIQSAKVVSHGPGRTMFRCIVSALVEINPTINPTGANKNIYEAVGAVVTACLGYSPDHPDDRFRLAQEPIEQSVHDPGLLSYLVHFEKGAVL